MPREPGTSRAAAQQPQAPRRAGPAIRWVTHCATRAATLALVALLCCPTAARAQNIESAIMPGKVIAGHAKVEQDCKACHVRFERAAQPGLCQQCHKDVGADIRGRRGFHGRLPAADCRGCHTDHRGRDARVIVLDERAFDHKQTDFALTGKHTAVKCASCHRPGSKHREAPGDCAGCHRNDDRHRGALGAQCETCHTTQDWKSARFDHAKTRFPLQARHRDVKCAECHQDPRFANTARECAACHRRVDPHKGGFGARCESCHNEGNWKPSTFAHDRDTRFVLRDRHRTARCESCHRGPLYREKLQAACAACHRADDPHKGSLGAKCEACHSEKSWKGGRFDHDHDTRFPLRERHREAKCETCHTAPGAREKPPLACVGCHANDDRDKGHRGEFGEKCAACHAERAWRQHRFDHGRDTPFALAGRHQGPRCVACHAGPLYGAAKAGRECNDCHQADDGARGHQGQLGIGCASCHDERGWRPARFDHDRSAFPLVAKHAGLACAKCHASAAFKDVRPECESCHAKEDPHRDRFGQRCGTCHVPQDWKRATFDHGRQTPFALAGVHARISCLACHRQPAREMPRLPGECIACHLREDVHFKTQGTQCERCHVSDDWRRIVRRDAQEPRR